MNMKISITKKIMGMVVLPILFICLVVGIISANIMTQNNHIELSVAKLIHIEHADKDSIPEIQEAVKKQLDSYMKTLNAGIKKYSR